MLRLKEVGGPPLLRDVGLELRQLVGMGCAPLPLGGFLSKLFVGLLMGIESLLEESLR